MQFSMQILQGAWAEPAGWALIATGLVVATWTLGGNGRRPTLDRPLRRLEPALSEPEAVQRLLAECAGNLRPAEVIEPRHGHEALPAPEPVARPLAA